MSNFSWEKSSFSKKFRKATSAQQFVGLWNKHVAPYLDPKSGKYVPQADVQPDVLASMSTSCVSPSTSISHNLHMPTSSTAKGSSTAKTGSSRKRTSHNSPSAPSSSNSIQLELPPSKKPKKDNDDMRIQQSFSGK